MHANSKCDSRHVGVKRLNRRFFRDWSK